MTELNVSATGAGQPVTQPEVREGNSSGGGQSGAVDFTASRVPTSDEAFGKSGLIITKGDVKAAQDELGMRTSAKTKERVANIHNKYARTILAMAGNDPALRAIANAHIAELPMASYKRDLAEYTHACQAKVDAFRADVQRLGLAESLVILDESAADRAALAEGAAAVRHQETLTAIDGATTTITVAIDEARTDINNYTAATGSDIKRTVRYEGHRTRTEVRKQGEATRQQVVNTGNDVVGRVTRNTAALLGVDAEGYTEKDPTSGERLLDNGQHVEKGAVDLVKDHSDKNAKEIKDNSDKNAKEIKDNSDENARAINGHTDEAFNRMQSFLSNNGSSTEQGKKKDNDNNTK